MNKIILLFLIFPITIIAQQKEAKKTKYKNQYVSYKETKIHIGKDTLLVHLYISSKGIEFAKVSQRLSKKTKDSIINIINKRNTKDVLYKN